VRLLFPLLIILLLAPLAQAQGIAEALQECPSTMSGSLQPEQIHLQITDSPTEMVVVWATEQRGDAVVEWSSESGSNSVTGDSYCYNHDKAFHMVVISGLTLGEEVTYRVGDGNVWSDEFTFTPFNPDADHFEWISIADHGLSSEALDVTAAIIADSDAQLVTISGDIAYADGNQNVWDEWFVTQQESMASIPWITAVGNHENEPAAGFEAYEHRFDSDQVIESETFWFSRNIPGVHLVFMSTEHEFTPGSAQFNWLQSDLQAANTPGARDERPFIIVIGHKPMYSSNDYHGSEVELRDALESLYVENGVNLVIAGHDHFYERTWPVNGEKVSDKGNGDVFGQGHEPIHLVIGIGGRSAYEELEEPQPEWSAYRENSSYGWTRLVYDDNTRQLEFTHHRIDGTIGDSFTLQESSIITESEESSALGVIGIDSVFAIIALLGAAIRKQ
jgi:hypothetical protein